MGERVVAREAEQHAERARRDLRVQPTACRVRGRGDVQLLAPEVRVRRRPGSARTRSAGRSRRPAAASTPVPFSGAMMSSPATPCGASSKTACPPAAIARPSPNSSSSAAKVPGTGSPSMARCPSVRDVEKPSAPASIASLHQSAHRRDVLGRGRLVAGAALAHRVGANRAVGHLAAHVDRRSSCLPIDVEVLGVGLPAPGDALGERGAGDVLDALHQLDQPVLVTRAAPARSRRRSCR